MKRPNPYLVGGLIGLTFLILRNLTPDLTVPPNLTCAARSADGCMVWTDQHRIDRYKAGEAGR